MLGGLMCAGFLLRVALTSRLTLPRVVELVKAIACAVKRPANGMPDLSPSLRSVTGKQLPGTILEPKVCRTLRPSPRLLYHTCTATSFPLLHPHASNPYSLVALDIRL